MVELDPAVTRLARLYFRYGELGHEPRLRVRHADARIHLRANQDRYDLVYLDVFDHLVSVPWTLVTVEALTSVKERLTEDGFLMVNVLSPPEGAGSAFLARFLSTLDHVFGAVRAYPVSPDLDPKATQNVLVMAARDLSVLPPWSGTRLVLPSDPRPLTDAHAPVEYLQARVFLEGLRWR